MIYYFSGTGNSKQIAKRMGEFLHDKLSPMTYDSSFSNSLSSDERLGFIFPVYGWGLPLVVEDFIKRMPTKTIEGNPYIYAILTCGDDIGRTDRLLHEALLLKGWKITAIFSVQMRNTYICLPGFDIDSKALAKKKEDKAFERLSEIGQRVLLQQSSTSKDVTPGDLPWIKSYILRPLFNRFLTSPKHFRVNKLSCTQCGRCAKICPLKNIDCTIDGHPHWEEHCTHCLACYHGCPQHAIEYGFFTKSKGQVKINF